MIDPSLWADVPHKNPTARNDWGGTHALYHLVMADVLSRAGMSYRTFPLGGGVGSPAWQHAHQQEHENANAAMGLSGPPQMTDVNFNSPEEFANFMFQHAQETNRQRKAAGIR